MVFVNCLDKEIMTNRPYCYTEKKQQTKDFVTIYILIA